MPLAAVIIPSPAPGASAVQSGAATPERMAAAAAFDALLGGAVDADARPAGDKRVVKDAGAKPDPKSPSVFQRDMRFGADLADQDGADVAAEIVLTVDGAPSGADAGVPGGQLSAALNDPARPAPTEGPAAAKSDASGGANRSQSAASTQIGEDFPAEASEDLPLTGDRPAQSAIATGAAAQVETDRAPAARNPGVRDRPVRLDPSDSADTDVKNADQKPVAAPEPAPAPDGETAAGAGAPEGLAQDKPQAQAMLASANEPPTAAAAPESAPEPGADPEADPDVDPEIVAQSAAPAPSAEAPANAASVRRESEPRRHAHGGDAAKAGDEPAKPSQLGPKAPPPSAPQAAAPAKPGAADMPAPQRSADAFQALLQAQTRPGAEVAAPRAPDLPLDPSGDGALRGSPDRAAEMLRSSAPGNTGAAPRFAPQTVQTLAAQIVRRQGEGGRVFDIRLDPPELGRVGVRLEMGKDQMVKAMLSAERPDTLQELQRTARDLERALADAGFNLAENGLSFTLGGERGERDEPGSGAPRSAESVVEIDVARPGAPAAALYGFALARAAGLDIQA